MEQLGLKITKIVALILGHAISGRTTEEKGELVQPVWYCVFQHERKAVHATRSQKLSERWSFRAA
jgi:hypothetical protein